MLNIKNDAAAQTSNDASNDTELLDETLDLVAGGAGITTPSFNVPNFSAAVDYNYSAKADGYGAFVEERR